MWIDGGWRVTHACRRGTVGGWRVTDGGWRVTHACRRGTVGGWRVTDGGWRVTHACRRGTVGGWRVTDGGWRVTHACRRGTVGGWRVTDGGWQTSQIPDAASLPPEDRSEQCRLWLTDEVAAVIPVFVVRKRLVGTQVGDLLTTRVDIKFWRTVCLPPAAFGGRKGSHLAASSREVICIRQARHSEHRSPRTATTASDGVQQRCDSHMGTSGQWLPLHATASGTPGFHVNPVGDGWRCAGG